MSNSYIVKDALARALQSLVHEHPLSKISVKDITQACNISRNTFYYHFSDKYELISWIFQKDMLENVNSFDDPTKLFESFSNVCKCLYQKRKFYLACFQYVGQNSLFEYILNYYCELFKVNLTMQYADVGVCLSESELYLMARMQSHSLVGIISDWVKDGMHDNYMKYFEEISIIQSTGVAGLATLNEKTQLEQRTAIATECKYKREA